MKRTFCIRKLWLLIIPMVYIIGLQGCKKDLIANKPTITPATNVAFDVVTDKFPKISDDELLTLVEQQTFKYFWDFGHPTSGLARERSNGDNNTVTIGGSGFGIMAIIVGIDRGFISKSDGLARISLMINFLQNNCTRYHGVFSHWVNGTTGATIPFSQLDDGGDIVETSYLLQGMLCARQYFKGSNAGETALRTQITNIYNQVEWNWYTNGQNTLFWHWSPDNGWEQNFSVSGWNEALITYVLAASSNSNPIAKAVYDNGWARNGGMKNGGTFYGTQLPLGPDYGGPLFLSQYSFLGINPTNLSDAYANYWVQNVAHSKINYVYCVANPKNYTAYGSNCWGLTASDINGGYTASSPTNDQGYIAPTAAISSLPYTTKESMSALRFFYYKLGNKIWGNYGFVDAFNLSQPWFATSFLAIDQGPQIAMIENYRTGLLWKLFMSCPEVKRGMVNLGFQSPDLSIPKGGINGYQNSGQVAASNLIAYWNFDKDEKEQISGIAPTSSSNDDFSLSGVKGKALSLNNGYVYYGSAIPALNSDTLKSFTVSEWVQIQNNGSTPTMTFTLARPGNLYGNINFILETGQNPASDVNDLIVHPNYADINGGTQDNLNAPWLSGYSSPQIGMGKWVHLVTTYDYSSNVLQIWANGKMIGATAYQQRGTATFKNTVPNEVIIGGWYNNVPGKSVTSDSYTVPMTGNLDELRVYNTALSSVQINSLYQLGIVGK